MKDNIFKDIIGGKALKRIRKYLLFFVWVIIAILAFYIFRPDIQILTSFPDIEYDLKEGELDAEIYFNKIGDGQIFEDLIFSVVDSATESIDVAIYSIRYPELIQKLDKKHQEGVKVRVIVPYANQARHFGEFFNSEFEIKTLGKSDDNFMHHKFILTDARTSNQSLISGSANFTKTQFNYDPGYMMKTSDEYIISAYSEEFERLWDGQFGFRKLFDKEYSTLSLKNIYNNGFFEVWMSPGYRMNSVKYRKIDLIEQAQESIKIIGWRINDTKILSALNRKIREGVSVEVLADDYYFYNEHSIVDNLLQSQRKYDTTVGIHSDSFLNLVFEFGLLDQDKSLDGDFNSFLHQHAMLIDDEILVNGTNNWGFNGFYANDENVFVTNVANLVLDFNNYFESLKKEIAGVPVGYEQKDNILIFNDLEPSLDLISYSEESFPAKRGEICFRGEIIGGRIEIPNNCLTKKTRIFIVDKNNELFSAFYLK